MLIIGSMECSEKSKEGKLFTFNPRVNRKQFSKIWCGFFLYPVIKSSSFALEVIEIITPLLIHTHGELPDLNVQKKSMENKRN